MEELRVLYGTSYDRESDGGIQFYENLGKVYTALINSTGKYTVSKFHFAFSKNKLLERMGNEDYNVIISDGTISTVGEDGEVVREGIGFSTIKGWLTDKPDTRVVIIEGSANRGKAKIGRLFKELYFYNIVFKPEAFTWKALMTEVVKVLENPRTAKEALEEYGIAEYEDVKEYLRENPWVMEGIEKPVVESVSSNNSEVSNEEAGDGELSKPVEEELVDEIQYSDTAAGVVAMDSESDIEDKEKDASDTGMGDIEAMMAESAKRFADFDDEETEEVIEEFVDPDEVEEEFTVQEPVDGEEFKFVDFEFDKESTAKSDGVVLENEEDVVEIPNETSDITTDEEKEFIFEYGAPVNEGPKVESSVERKPVEEGAYREVEKTREVLVFNRGSLAGDGLMPTKGYIKSIVDYDTLLVEFDNEVCMVENLDEYRCIVKVRSGMKGRVENGRYKSANISFDAFFEAVIDSRTAMVEVPEFDCEEKRSFLEGKECNFVFVKM